MNTPNIPKRIATAIINSLKGGVVPRVGLPYVTVGRKAEIDALLHDIEIIAQGGASFRFVSGRYGSGKSFLMQTIRNYAMDRNFVVADADLSPERRLHGSKGQGLSTYKELIQNLSTKTRPEGGALALILDRWINNVQSEVKLASGLAFDDPQLGRLVENKIHETISALNEMVHGFEFARLLTFYYRAHLDGADEDKAKVLKWFRGEYASKAEARGDLGIGIIITDDDWYEHIKLFAMFLKKAGYSGLLVLVDELVNIYKIPNSITRQYNYEKILTMYNDTLQGKASHLGIIMGGTPQSIEDTRRGVFSYEALRSRLEDGRFSRDGLKDVLAPVIKLAPLTAEEMLVLVEKLSAIHAGLFECGQTISHADMADFIRIEFSRIGSDTSITPREVIRDYIELLNIAHQNPGVRIAEILGADSFAFAKNAVGEAADAELAGAENGAANNDGAPEKLFDEFEL
jgi:Protein of unknown function (DUF2791).